MPSFKINFTLVCTILLAFKLQAEEPIIKIGQSPPFEINVGDTSSLIHSELDSIMHLRSEKMEAVEDTVLPPCDVIFYKSGKLEYCKIIETTSTTVTYKMCDYLDGPNIVVNRSDIHKIRYANGKEEIVSAEKQQTKNAYIKPKKDVLATLSLIFGLSSAAVVLLFAVVIPAVALAGITLGIISIIKIQRRKGELRGTGAAIIGVVLCMLVLLLLAL